MNELMKLNKRKIKITQTKHITLSEQTLFKADGGEGLHLWESAIVFSRFINKYPEEFVGKKVIELGSGCGLLGIACLMYTNCAQITLSDYQDSVIDNLINNLKENKVNHSHTNNNFESFLDKVENERTLNNKEDNDTNFKSIEACKIKNNINHCVGCYPGRFSFMKLDWRDYDKYKVESFDIVIGAELVWQGGCVEELVKIIKNLLKQTGKALIAMPKKRGMTEVFLKLIENNQMNYTAFSIDEDDLLIDPLENEKESKKLFEDLKSTNVIIYEIKKS